MIPICNKVFFFFHFLALFFRVLNILEILLFFLGKFISSLQPALPPTPLSVLAIKKISFLRLPLYTQRTSLYQYIFLLFLLTLSSSLKVFRVLILKLGLRYSIMISGGFQRILERFMRIDRIKKRYVFLIEPIAGPSPPPNLDLTFYNILKHMILPLKYFSVSF